MAIIASVPSQPGFAIKTNLLGFSPFQDEVSQDADHLRAFCEYVLDLFANFSATVIALLGDNCSTNRSFAHKISVPFVGCALHRFILAMQ